MKLWKIVRQGGGGYDTYDSAVVAALNEEDASFTHPSSRITEWDGVDKSGSWCNASKVNVQYLGTTDRDIHNKTVIVSSFNAG